MIHKTNFLDHRHALKFDLLSKEHQMRTLRRLENQARQYAKDTLQNASSTTADLMSYHRKVRLSREARAINLFRAYLKGLPYRRVEASNRPHTLHPEILISAYLTYDKLLGEHYENLYNWFYAEEEEGDSE